MKTFNIQMRYRFARYQLHQVALSLLPKFPKFVQKIHKRRKTQLLKTRFNKGKISKVINVQLEWTLR